VNAATQAGPLGELLRRHGLDSIDGAFAWTGGEDMTAVHLKGRQRWTMDLDDAQGRTWRVYMKRYLREGLGQRLSRLLTYGWHRSPAGVELAMIRACQAAGVGTIDQAEGGEEFDCRGARRSYIIMTAVPGEPLEQSAGPFIERCGLDSRRVVEFTRLLAGLVRRFHAAGLVHRDLYNCHIFLHEPGGPAGAIELRLIDLARAFRPRWRRFRWRVKDLAQLKHSMPREWVSAHWGLFMDEYLPGERAAGRGRLERAIDHKVATIRRRGTHEDRHGLPYGYQPKEPLP